MQKKEIEITKQEAQFYGEHLPWLTAAIAAVQETIHTWRRLRLEEAGEDPRFTPPPASKALTACAPSFCGWASVPQRPMR